MRSIKLIYLYIILSVTVGCLMQSSLMQPSTHGHLSLVAYPSRPLLSGDDLKLLTTKVKDSSYWASSAKPSDNSLDPCSLLVIGVLAVYNTNIWYPLSTGKPLTPLLGKKALDAPTLRKFSEDLKSGYVPRDDPVKAAEITARLFIYFGGGINLALNNYLVNLSQQECLHEFGDPGDALPRIFNALSTKTEEITPEIMAMHLPIVARYSATLSRDEIEERFIKEIHNPGFLTSSAQSTDNPLAPCSLLRAVRLSSHLNQVWKEIGPVTSNDSEEARKATLMIATAFMEQGLRKNADTEFLLSHASQQECLDELFSPGLIRKKLMLQGKPREVGID